jgi:hypothetical protein
MLVLLVAAAKILTVKVGTSIDPACLPCVSLVVCDCCSRSLMLMWTFWKLICLEQSTFHRYLWVVLSLIQLFLHLKSVSVKKMQICGRRRRIYKNVYFLMFCSNLLLLFLLLFLASLQFGKEQWLFCWLRMMRHSVKWLMPFLRHFCCFILM